ncbi:hypothetical protein BJ742DRAFT_778241 [Cladochytrium replicatum]|nr:hypothetical protein BJ742DRAFT_778241 [Cladochytrium replicatum]
MATTRKVRAMSVGDPRRPAVPLTAPLTPQREAQDEDHPPSLGLKRMGGLEDLNDALTKRPTRQELIERNILKSENSSGKIQAISEQLKRHQLEDTLRNKLQIVLQAGAANETGAVHAQHTNAEAGGVK